MTLSEFYIKGKNVFEKIHPELIKDIKEVYMDKDFIERIKSSKKNWTNISEETAVEEIIKNLDKFL